jgi:peptide/nickel transport system substrate-binding protein
MKEKIKRWSALVLAMAMIASLSACGGGSSDSTATDGDSATTPATESSSAETPSGEGATEAASSGDITYGGTFTTYWSEFYNEFDASANDNRNFIDLYCNSLWALDAENATSELCETLTVDDIQGSVAKSWEVSDDYTTLTVTIRDDVYFADKTAVGIDAQYDVYGGRQLVASDVKYSYDRVMGLDGVEQVVMDQTDWGGSLYMLDSVEAPDDTTVIFHFNTDNELQVDNFMCVMLNLCGPEWDTLSDDQKTDWRYAGGTGAFILTDYVNDNTMTFVANPNYWETDSEGNQLPYLGTIKLVHMTDTATMLSAFISGELQALLANNVLIDADQASTLPAGTYTSYTYGSDCPAVCIKLGDNPVPALADLNVRIAMQYAIDSDAISAYKGYTYATEADKNVNLFYKGLSIADTSALSDELIASYTTYDPDLAKQMLADAGYADGFSFDVYLYQAQPIDSFQLAAEYLAAVGITMNINVCSTPPEMTAHGADRTDPASMYGSVGTSRVSSISAVVRSDGPMNNVFQDDAEIDTLCDAFANATTADEQKEAAAQLNAAYLAQHYYLITSYAQEWESYISNSVHGFNGARWTLCYNAGEIMSHMWVD